MNRTLLLLIAAGSIDVSDDLTTYTYTYTFTIDVRARWSDDTPVTAHDVKFLLPQHVFRGLNVDEILAHPYLELPTVTSGPFTVSAYVRGEFWRLERVAGYRGGEPSIENLVERAEPTDPGDAVVALDPARCDPGVADPRAAPPWRRSA